MNTNQAIENLNDANIFHKLAWSILGLANSEYYSLNNPGLNERDQSIKSPLDSCAWINNKYVCVEYTITKNKGKRLESKWLNAKETTTKPLGDLIKQINEIQKLKLKFPKAKYKAILCSNQKIATNVENKCIFRLQEYSDENAFDAIKNILGNKFSKVDIWKLASILKNDPYLISLLNEVPKNQNIKNIFEIAHNICNFYINKIIKEIASKTNYLAEEIEEQLDILLYNLLLNKNLFPTFLEIQGFEKINIGILRAIFKNTKICFLSNKKLLFSHDRIKEYLLGRAIINKYSQVNQIDESILVDPYYIDIIAKCLPEIKINSTDLNTLLNKNPIAIFASVKYINDFENYYLRDETLQIFKKEYLTHNEIYYDEIAKCLYDINSKEFVKNIDNNFSKELKKKNYNSWNLLSFKFGYLSNGVVYYYSRYNSWGIAYDNNFISNIFYLKQKYSNISITKSFDTMFEKINPKLLDSTFLAAGFFELKDINRQVENYWVKTTHKEESLPYIIFALLKCFNGKTPHILDKLMHFLKGLSEDSKSGLSDKRSIITILRLGMKPHLNPEAIKYLIGYATKNPDEACIIYTILDDIDDKFVFEFKCNYYVKNPRMLDLGDHNWNINNQRQIKKISTESLLHLKKLWLNQNNDDRLRYKALKFYHTYATKEDVSYLKKMSTTKKTDENLRSLAIITRARLSDLSVIDELIILAKKHPHYWHEFQNIWTENGIDILNQELKQKDKECRNHFIFDLLQRIPKNNATDIIKINWNKFNKDPDFLAAAFQVGTDVTLDLLINRLTGSRKPVSIRFFGCSYQSDKTSIKLNSNSFEKISPYYNKIDKESLSGLLLDLDRSDKELSKNALKELFINLDDEEKAKNCYFKFLPRTEDDIINDLKVLKNKEEPIYFYRDFISNNKEKILKTLPIWSENNRDYESFKLYAEILKLVGSRQDISNFEIFKNYFMETTQKEIVNNTYATTIFTIMRKSLL